MNFNFLFLRSTSKHSITQEAIFNTFTLHPKRICFKTAHKNALKKTGYPNGPANALFFPFENTIKKIYEIATGLNIYQMKNGKYWGPLNNENELMLAESFCHEFKEVVFLRDELEISCAISEYCYFENDIQHRTIVGDLENRAKNMGDVNATQQLLTIVTSFINKTPCYKDANYICGVPSSKGLPAQIANILSGQNNKLTDLSNYISFKNEKEEVKNKKNINERWRILEEADLQVSIDVKEKRIILLDDMYQTGITMQYIAMKLIEAGASNVFGLSIVKSASNSL